MLRFALPMRRCTIVALPAAVLLVTLTLAPRGAGAFLAPHVHRQIKQQVEDLESQWRTATLSGDATTIDRLLSDDYVGISWTGEVSTKAMQLDRVRNHALALTRLDLSDAKIKLLGNVAIVTALANVEGTNEGATMKGMFRYTRVYQRLPAGTWKITNFEVTRISDPRDRHHARNLAQ